ncbi:hypothetical protein PAMP_005532 [Pampus punctatissimus]
MKKQSDTDGSEDSWAEALEREPGFHSLIGVMFSRAWSCSSPSPDSLVLGLWWEQKGIRKQGAFFSSFNHSDRAHRAGGDVGLATRRAPEAELTVRQLNGAQTPGAAAAAVGDRSSSTARCAQPGCDMKS